MRTIKRIINAAAGMLFRTPPIVTGNYLERNRRIGRLMNRGQHTRKI